MRIKTKSQGRRISNLQEFESLYLPKWKQRTLSQTRAELLASIPEEIIVEKILSGDFNNILNQIPKGEGRKSIQSSSSVASSTQDADKEASLDEAIDALYKEISILLKTENHHSLLSTKESITQKLKNLRELQTIRAQQLGDHFHRELLMPIDAGHDAISVADKLLKRYGNITPS